MLNDNTGHTARRRQRGEQFGNRLKATLRGSHGYDRSCHTALLGATHPALDGTTTVVLGRQYRPARMSKRRSNCNAQSAPCAVRQEPLSHATASPLATGRLYRANSVGSLHPSWHSGPSRPLAAAGAGSMREKCSFRPDGYSHMTMNNLDEIKAAIQKLPGPDRQTLRAWLATASSGADNHSSAYDADILYDRVAEPAKVYRESVGTVSFARAAA
jgi:hypothetical protein